MVQTVVLSNSHDRCSLDDLAQRAVEVSEGLTLAGVVAAGGETAGTLVEAFGARGIWLCDELEPGVPLGNLAGGEFDGLPIATKAGGFGSPDTLVRMTDALRSDAGER